MAYLRFTNEGGVQAIVTFDATEREAHVGTALVTEHPIETGGNVTDHVRAENDTLALDILITNTPLSEKSHDAVGPDGNLQNISHLDGSRGTVQTASVFFSVPPRRLSGPRLLIEGSPPRSIKDVAPAIGLGANIVGLGALGGIAFTGLTSIDIIPGIAPVWEEGARAPESVGDTGVKTLRFTTDFDRVRTVYEVLNGMRGKGQIVEIVTGLRVYKSMVIEGFSANRDAQTGNAFVGSLFAKQIRTVDSQTVQVTEPLEPRGQKQSKRGKQVPAPSTDEETEKANTTKNSWAAGVFGFQTF